MDTVTLLWSINATVALTLAGFSARAWTIERRDLSSLMCCLIAISTAACVPGELALMHATTPAEYGEWLRWLHIPAFFAAVSQLLFVRSYLGKGRLWLLWTIVSARIFVLIGNFAVHPNFNFREIVSLRRVSFLGEQVSIVGNGVVRSWQWIAAASMWLIIVFVADAAIQSKRTGPPWARRRALTVGLGMVAPMVVFYLIGQLAVFGVLRTPLFISPGLLGMLSVIAYELSRDIAAARRAPAHLADLRSQLAQLDRLSILGQLASALTHELGQPLTAIMSNAQAAQHELRARQPHVEDLYPIVADIRRDATRATEIMGRMRALIKHRSIEVQPIALNEVVQDALALVHTESSLKNITVEAHIRPGLPRVSGDRVHIVQVLLNLIMNGMDAVQSRPRNLRRVLVEAWSDDAAERVEVAVRDSGPGIPDAVADNLYTPLFTTKTAGLGIGLALCRTIIEAHGGRIWAEPRGDLGGATFRFTLPRARRGTRTSVTEDELEKTLRVATDVKPYEPGQERSGVLPTARLPSHVENTPSRH